MTTVQSLRMASAVLLGSPTSLRGSGAEFRRFGVAIVTLDDVFAALLEVGRNEEAVLIVSSEFNGAPLREVLELAGLACGPRVILGLGEGDPDAPLRTAVTAGVHATVTLPLTPVVLAREYRRFMLPQDHDQACITVGSLSVNAARHHVQYRDTRIDMTARELAILHAIVRAHPQLATLAELEAEFAGTANPTGAIRAAIKRLRSRLAEAGVDQFPAIESVRGVGYRLAS